MFRETSTNINNLNSINIQEALNRKSAKKDFYFYQGKYLIIQSFYKNYLLINILNIINFNSYGWSTYIFISS